MLLPSSVGTPGSGSSTPTSTPSTIAPTPTRNRDTLTDWLRQHFKQAVTAIDKKSSPKPANLGKLNKTIDSQQQQPISPASEGTNTLAVDASVDLNTLKRSLVDEPIISTHLAQRHRDFEEISATRFPFSSDDDADASNNEDTDANSDSSETNQEDTADDYKPSDNESRYSSDLEKTTDRIAALGLGIKPCLSNELDSDSVQPSPTLSSSTAVLPDLTPPLTPLIVTPTTPTTPVPEIIQYAPQQTQHQPPAQEPPTTCTIQPNYLPTSTSQIHTYLASKRLQLQNPHEDPAASFETAKAIISSLPHLSYMPSAQRDLLQTSLRCLQKISSMKTNPVMLSADVQHYLAGIYIYGVPGIDLYGVENYFRDYGKAFVLYKSAAKKGHLDSRFLVGRCYEFGQGVGVSYLKAVHHYRKAAAGNHPGAMHRLGSAVLHGQLRLQRNQRDAIKWITRSVRYATPEHSEAIYTLAMLYNKGLPPTVYQDVGYCRRLLERGVEVGSVRCMFTLGIGFERGLFGCCVDPKKSFGFHLMAAERGWKESMFELGGWYLTGIYDSTTNFHLPQSDSESLKWIAKAAECGYSRAYFAMGYFCERGIGRDLDTDSGCDLVGEAVEWYRKGAEFGDLKAIKRLKELDSLDMETESASDVETEVSRDVGEVEKGMDKQVDGDGGGKEVDADVGGDNVKIEDGKGGVNVGSGFSSWKSCIVM
ncbi:hypothetical protein HDU76_001126 [Blyttiomyces sp. JEL0837]|nr:hypothetical protein HDU76_001126 [Blyttiomyces sp. JEL0837]